MRADIVVSFAVPSVGVIGIVVSCWALISMPRSYEFGWWTAWTVSPVSVVVAEMNSMMAANVGEGLAAPVDSR